MVTKRVQLAVWAKTLIYKGFSQPLVSNDPSSFQADVLRYLGAMGHWIDPAILGSNLDTDVLMYFFDQSWLCDFWSNEMKQKIILKKISYEMGKVLKELNLWIPGLLRWLKAETLKRRSALSSRLLPILRSSKSWQPFCGHSRKKFSGSNEHVQLLPSSVQVGKPWCYRIVRLVPC